MSCREAYLGQDGMEPGTLAALLHVEGLVYCSVPRPVLYTPEYIQSIEMLYTRALNTNVDIES